MNGILDENVLRDPNEAARTNQDDLASSTPRAILADGEYRPERSDIRTNAVFGLPIGSLQNLLRLLLNKSPRKPLCSAPLGLQSESASCWGIEHRGGRIQAICDGKATNAAAAPAAPAAPAVVVRPSLRGGRFLSVAHAYGRSSSRPRVLANLPN